MNNINPNKQNNITINNYIITIVININNTNHQLSSTIGLGYQQSQQFFGKIM